MLCSILFYSILLFCFYSICTVSECTIAGYCVSYSLSLYLIYIFEYKKDDIPHILLISISPLMSLLKKGWSTRNLKIN